MKKIGLVVNVAGLVLLVATGIANATSVIWNFNLPSTATASQNPPYPSVATLTLTQMTNGVQFLLDPNQASPGVKSHSEDVKSIQSVPVYGKGKDKDKIIGYEDKEVVTGTKTVIDTKVDQIDFVYMGAVLTGNWLQYDSGAPIKKFSYETNPNNMDSGYKANDQHIIIDFFSKNNDDPNKRFYFDQLSTWTILGTTLADFTDTYATSKPKPSPIAGIISISPYDLTDPHPTPSNWVAGADVSPVPLPAAGWLFGSALLGFISMSSRRKI